MKYITFGAQSHVKVSFEIPEYTAETVAIGTTRLLEAIRDSGIQTKFYQASSSEMFGNVSRKDRRMKKRHFIRAALTRPPRSTLIG